MSPFDGTNFLHVASTHRGEYMIQTAAEDKSACVGARQSPLVIYFGVAYVILSGTLR